MMGLVLHDWNLDRKMLLSRRRTELYARRRTDRHREHHRRRRVARTFRAIMSLNMIIELGDAFDFTGADLAGGAPRSASRRLISCRWSDRQALVSRTSKVLTSPALRSMLPVEQVWVDRPDPARALNGGGRPG